MTDKATPRPWRVRIDERIGIWVDAPSQMIDNGMGRSYSRQILEDEEYPEKQADAELIVAAVNSYDPAREEKIRKLVEAAKASMNCHSAMNERALHVGLAGTSDWDAVAFDSLTIRDKLRAAIQDMEKPE